MRVGLIFGGNSPEHSVSITSAKRIYDHIVDHEVLLFGIDKVGHWSLLSEEGFLLATLQKEVKNGGVLPLEALVSCDVAFPVIHGATGEDGTLQGLLEMLKVPYVGAGVLGNAVGMSKELSKRIVQNAGFPVAPFVSLTKESVIDVSSLQYPLFVKPDGAGSSVGISRVEAESELFAALDAAFMIDDHVIVEEGFSGIDVEVAVLNSMVSDVGAIYPRDTFYSAKAKERIENARYEVPARLPEEVTTKIQAAALRIAKQLRCESMARVDFLVSENGDFVFNEINTIPGFTELSLYPKLFASMTYAEVIDHLIRSRVPSGV